MTEKQEEENKKFIRVFAWAFFLNDSSDMSRLILNLTDIVQLSLISVISFTKSTVFGSRLS